MTFTDKLKELVREATKGPWDNRSGTIRVVINDDLCCPVFESRTPAELGKGKSYDARFADAWKQEHANAALIVHLVNHADLIVEMVEAAKGLANTADGLRIEEDGIRELVGHTNWEVLRHWIGEVRATLSRLDGGKP